MRPTCRGAAISERDARTSGGARQPVDVGGDASRDGLHGRRGHARASRRAPSSRRARTSRAESYIRSTAAGISEK